MKYLMVALLVLYVSSTAYANCIYNGQSYPVGTVLGPMVCTSDGTWRQR